jgi:hypothetical protein
MMTTKSGQDENAVEEVSHGRKATKEEAEEETKDQE